MGTDFKRLSKILAKTLKVTEENLEDSFQLAALSDIPALSSIRREVYGAEIKDNDEAYLTWRYFSRAGYESTLWIFKYNDEIIGAVGSEPIDLIAEGEIIPALRNMDAIIRPDFNSSGIGAWMNLALREKYDCILVSGGNKNSESMLRKLFESLPVRQSYKLFFSSRNFLRNRFNAPLSICLAPIVDLLLKLFISVKRFRHTGRNYAEIKSFDDILELIELLPDIPGTLGKQKAYRSKEYMYWRYAQYPGLTFKALGLFQGTDLIAYLIYYCLESGSDSIRRQGRIVDWEVYDSSQTNSALISIFNSATKNLQTMNVDEILIVLNDLETQHAISALGYLRRNVDDRFFVFCKDRELRDRLLCKESWYLSLSDSDRFE